VLLGLVCAGVVVLGSRLAAWSDEIVDRWAEDGSGHMRVVPASGDLSDRGPRLADWRHDRDALIATTGVRISAPRLRLPGTLQRGARRAEVEVVGVDPRVEQRAFPRATRIADGRYLEGTADAGIVLGRGLADRLGAAVGDSLEVSILNSGGQPTIAVRPLRGVVESGLTAVDAAACQVPLAEAERLSGRRGASEIAVLLGAPRDSTRVRRHLQHYLARGDRLANWGEYAPEAARRIQTAHRAGMGISLVALAAVMWGVRRWMRGTLDRRRAFAAIVAIASAPALAFLALRALDRRDPSGLEAVWAFLLAVGAAIVTFRPGPWYSPPPSAGAPSERPKPEARTRVRPSPRGNTGRWRA
jgi:ABC-type lipoprotein release transport system permease subunit